MELLRESGLSKTEAMSALNAASAALVSASGFSFTYQDDPE
jgi:hypothetical protein